MPENPQAASIIRRYNDAYLVAKAVVGFGKSMRVLALLIAGVAIVILVTILSDAPIQVKAGVAAIACLVAFFVFLFGTLVSALGQILKASLDGAVNTSPFLEDIQRARIMSLAESS